MLARLMLWLPTVRCLIEGGERWLAPVVDLLIRLALFRVFFGAGVSKLSDWSSTLTLFRSEYSVPVLSGDLAAVMATTDELVCSVLVLVGLAARLAAIPLLAQVVVIQFVLGAANPVYNTPEHALWMVLLLAVIARGPGGFSVDHAFRHRLLKPWPL